MSKKNKKYLIIVGSICLIVLLIYASYVHWTNYKIKKETIASLEWAVPLSLDYSYEDIYNNSRREKLEKELEQLNLQLVVAENKEKEDSIFNELYGVKNYEEKLIIPVIYEELQVDAEENYILAEYYSPADHGTYNYHYYNLDGTDFIKGEFECASLFENGYACVKKNGNNMVISTNGKELLHVKCDDLTIYNSDRGLFELSNDNATVYEYGNATTYEYTPRKGIIDISGKIILEPKYRDICKIKDNKILIEKINKGQEEWMFLDNNFKPILGKIYDRANPFYKGITTVKYKGEWYIINENEEVIAEIEDCQEVDAFYEGIAMVECNKELKYIDTTGKVLFTVPKRNKDCHIFDCYRFSEGKIVFESINREFGYMDTKGKVIVPPIFDNAAPVRNGEAYVEIGNKAGVIKF